MLNVDSFFYDTLRNNNVLNAYVDGRIFNPERLEMDDTKDKIPYIIIKYGDGTAENGSKDKIFAELDTATIHVLCVDEDRDTLANLTQLVYDTIEAACDEEIVTDTYVIEAITPQAGGVELDPLKPCCYQTLSFRCDTNTPQ